MKVSPVTLLLTVALSLSCGAMRVSNEAAAGAASYFSSFGGARFHTIEKRDAEEKTPPFGVMSTCICYPMSEGLPEGFPGKSADPAQLSQWANNQGGGGTAVESVAEAQASADINAPTYVQIYKDDSVDPETLA